MTKKLVVLIACSIVLVLFMSYVIQALQWLIDGHQFISHLLTNVFSPGQAGTLARGLLALLTVPVLAGLIPTMIYWMIRRSWFPYFIDIVWVIWLVQAGALVMLHPMAIASEARSQTLAAEITPNTPS